MPATAAQPGDAETPHMASVVDLSSRRRAEVLAAADDTGNAELQEQANRYWRGVFEKAGVDLGSQETGAVVSLITRELERLVGGLVSVREGREDLPADPDSGVDFNSAVEVTSLLRDLARAAEAARE
ncbi:hypothetical protein EDD90_2840 [Streptomyces sp. Ag109_O5-1]|uniref:hypothetical protein n=1 Tax=Streptomyces sp. Ag109_O5-1 TaxID=1938851 RepID=UPI000F4FAA32|nr:hypothetical protein [Streptomyces sp. Ag109_O5-1]RPE39822.1 hypothetical protein EDD90_2840 [Streptomyces sp. Ag109_O5-1]